MKKYTEFIKEALEAQPAVATPTKVGGKNIFRSFLKMITAMGLKEHKPDWEHTPKDFILYYLFEDVDCAKLKLVLARFRSLSTFSDVIEYTHNSCYIYFGIKCDMTFEYGFKTDVLIPAGRFPINKLNYGWMLLLDSPSAASLKKEIVELDPNTILFFGKIKKEMANYSPGYSEKKSIPVIKNAVISFGYYGVTGNWKNGSMNADEFNNIKSNIKLWLSKFRWSKRILISVTQSSFWIYFNFKIK